MELRTKIANLLSTLAHPMLLVPAYAMYVTFAQLTGSAVTICVSITLLTSVLLIVYMVRQVRKGVISNLDASVQSERQHRVFLPIIGLLTASYALFYLLNQPKSVLTSTFFLCLLFIVGYFLNFFIKASLHLAIPLFLAILSLHTNLYLSCFLFFLSPFIAWSRYVLKRHSLAELAAGMGLAIVIGGLYTFFI